MEKSDKPNSNSMKTTIDTGKIQTVKSNSDLNISLHSKTQPTINDKKEIGNINVTNNQTDISKSVEKKENEVRKMDKFPENFTRPKLNIIMKQNQEELLKIVRAQFFEKVLLAVNDSVQRVDLIFPDNLWAPHRLILAKEIVNNFGEVKMTTTSNNVVTTRLVSESGEIPNNIKKIEIEFFC